MRVLLDTNVLIDYYAKREPYYQDAFKLRVMQEFGDVELWASIQSFSDISYILCSEANSQQLQHAFLASLSFLHVCSLDQNNLEKTCQASWEDFEDCLVARCAEKLKAEFILTRDQEGFVRSSTQVLTPSEFFASVLKKYGLDYDLIEFPVS